MLAFYLLKVMLCSGLLLGYYWLALRNKAFHQWNRFFLLSITALSLVLPLMQFPVVFENDSAYTAARYISIATLDETVVTAVQEKSFISLSAEQWVLIAYALVSLALLVMALKAVKGILNILRHHPKEELKGIYFIQANAPGTPFSFFNYLVWNRNLDLHSEAGQQIFRHELAHVTQRHTLDKCFFIILLIPFWCNPFFWIIRRELNDIHEFLADEKALEGGSTTDLSKMILNALYPQHHHLLISPFFQSSIKRRLQMVAIQNQKFNYMSRILALPVVLIVFAVQSCKPELEESTGKQQMAQKENKTLLKTGTKAPDVANKNKAAANGDDVLVKVDEEAQFNGNWGAFLQANLNPVVPVNNGAPAGKYTVIAQFIVDEEGNLLDLKPVTSHGYGMEEEVIRAMKLSPNWKPAKYKGEVVAAYRKQPVTFVIAEE